MHSFIKYSYKNSSPCVYIFPFTTNQIKSLCSCVGITVVAVSAGFPALPILLCSQDMVILMNGSFLCLLEWWFQQIHVYVPAHCTGISLQPMSWFHVWTFLNLLSVYHCGSPEAGWSDIHSFTAMRSGTDWSPSIVLYGDLGNANPQSIPRLQEDVAKGMYDAVLHVGKYGIFFLRVYTNSTS